MTRCFTKIGEFINARIGYLYFNIINRFLTEIINKQAISKIYLFGDLNENNEFVKGIREIAEKSHCEFDTIGKEPDYIERLNMTLSHYN